MIPVPRPATRPMAPPPFWEAKLTGPLLCVLRLIGSGSTVRGAVRPTLAFAAHAIRAARLLATDRRIPRAVRGLVVVGALPVPGPVDEAVLLVAAGILYTFYRQPMREA